MGNFCDRKEEEVDGPTFLADILDYDSGSDFDPQECKKEKKSTPVDVVSPPHVVSKSKINSPHDFSEGIQNVHSVFKGKEDNITSGLSGGKEMKSADSTSTAENIILKDIQEKNKTKIQETEKVLVSPVDGDVVANPLQNYCSQFYLYLKTNTLMLQKSQ